MSIPGSPPPTKNRTRGFLFGAAAVLLAVCLCLVLIGVLGSGAFFSRQSQVAQASETATAQALATAYPANPPANWPVVLTDTFNSNENGWSISDQQPEINNSGTFRETIAGGKFRIESNAAESVAKQFWPQMRDVSDLYASVDAQRTDGDVAAAYGLILHWNTTSNFLGDFYFFEIRDDRQFGLFLYSGNWIHLIELTRSDAIRPGAVNHLAVLFQGSTLACFINNQPVGAVDDSHEPSGAVGLGIDMTRGQASFEFSNFELRAPP